MRLLPLLLILSMVLAACGGAADTPTTAPAAATDTPVAAAPTDTVAAAAPTDTVAAVAPTDTVAAAAATDTPAAAAGATATKPKPQGSQAGTLTLWVDEAKVNAMTNAGKAFTEKYKVPVNVQQLAFGDIRDQLKLAGPAGEGPDIIVGAHDWLGELVTNGLLEPLDLGDKASNIDPVALKAFSYNGKQYGLPYGVEAIALVYNKELVPTPPTTWDELKSMAQKLQDEKKVDQGYVLQQGDPYHFYPIETGFGGYVFKYDPATGIYDPNDVGLDSPGGIAAMQELDSMVKSGLLRKDITGDIQKSLFIEGKSAMWFTGPWSISDLKKSAVADKFAVTKIPMMKQEAQPFVGAQGFMVSAFGKNKDIAKAFLTEFVATDDVMNQIVTDDPRIAAWKPVAEKQTDPYLKGFAESAATGVPMPNIPQMSAVWTDWTKAINLVFQQQQDPAGAIKDAATAIREKIASGK
jgi:maltose/maltodextrin transport system substrate-binding protein/arabinogalactan oligomer/maltooligosaccharide transport system substrate-binding protein